MAEQIGQTKAKIRLKSFLADFRSPLTDAELKEKYHLSARTLVSLIRALLEKNFITAEDLAWRREMAVQRDLAKESEFLAGLYICPHCSHPHPRPFTTCPACGGDTGDVFAEQELLTSILTSPSDDTLTYEEEQPDVLETQLLETMELPVSPKETDSPAEQATIVKPSTFQSFRSIISKLKKK
jgi:hypothetical protein